jgi:hypothetical protein
MDHQPQRLPHQGIRIGIDIASWCLTISSRLEGNGDEVAADFKSLSPPDKCRRISRDSFPFHDKTLAFSKFQKVVPFSSEDTFVLQTSRQSVMSF